MKNKKTALLLLQLFTAVLFQNLSAGDLSLNEYMSLVESNNRGLQKSALNNTLAEIQKNLARAAFLPKVSGSVGYTRNVIELSQSHAIGAEPAVNPDTGLYDLYYTDVPSNFDNEMSFQLSLQQTLFDVNAQSALKAGKVNKAMTDTSTAKVRTAILTGAKKLYYQVVLLQEVYEIRKATESNALENFRNVQEKYENQLVAEIDVKMAQVNWQISVPDTSVALRDLQLGMSNLKQLAGIDASEELKLTDSLGAVPSLPEEMTQEQTLERSLDYRIQTQALALKEINVDSQKSSFYPTVNLTAGYAHNFLTDDVLDNNNVDVFKVGLNVNIPLFYGGSRIQKVRQAEIEREIASIDLLLKQDEILNESNNIYLKLREADKRMDIAQSAWETTRKAYEVVKISVENGLSTQLDMKEARLNMDNARLGYYSAVYDYLSFTFDWQQTMGITYN